MFTRSFDNYLVPGDQIQCDVDGFECVAVIEYDEDTKAHEYDQPGWCFDTTSEEHGEANRAIIKGWEENEWHYCSVVVHVWRNNVLLATRSLSGIEMNFPEEYCGDRTTPRHAYHREVANELLVEALDAARATILDLAKSL